MRILGIESSCDETGAAIVEDGRIIRANVVASQASIHERYGGVVPEVGSRILLSSLFPVLETALAEAGAGWATIDGISATYGPGLAGSLLVGLTGAKALALAHAKPFIGVNHLEAHIYANWLHTSDAAGRPEFPELPADTESESWPGDPVFPLLALVISGAHSELVHIPRHGHYELLGQTRDDAAGEAFDKVSRVLGLGYPGGPAIERAAARAEAPNAYALPRAWLPGTYDFSFSGLKTAVLQVVEGAREGDGGTGASRYTRMGAAARAHGALVVPAVAAAFQEAVVDVLAAKTVRAARALSVRQVLLAGGVAANTALRVRLARDLAPLEIALRAPAVALCTDNAAMIAAAGYFHLRLGERSGFDIDVRPGLQLPFAERPSGRNSRP
ncbi:MAG: tRNA (adenosine(37)-N6)-threonylcarbamoyltransferase complex transferase subunit TsaD [Ktedonobacterales bacterium]